MLRHQRRVESTTVANTPYQRYTEILEYFMHEIRIETEIIYNHILIKLTYKLLSSRKCFPKGM